MSPPCAEPVPKAERRSYAGLLEDRSSGLLAVQQRLLMTCCRNDRLVRPIINQARKYLLIFVADANRYTPGLDSAAGCRAGRPAPD